MTPSNLREAIMDDILGHDYVGLTIFYCPGNKSMVMSISKWLLIQTIVKGFSLKELLFSYDENYVLEVDVEGMIGAKKKIITSIRENGKRLCS